MKKIALTRKTTVSLVGVLASLVAAAGIFAATSGGASQGPAPSPSAVAAAAQAAADRIGPANVGAVTINGTALQVGIIGTEGYTAHQIQLDWYAKLLASSVAHTTQGIAEADYADPLGRDEVGPDLVTAIQAAPTALPSGGCQGLTNDAASPSGAQLVSARSIDLLGGACEVTVTGGYPRGLVAGTSGHIGTLEAALADQNRRPFLLTVVDSTGTPLGVIGWTPGIGGDYGQGISWSAPGVQNAAVSSGSATGQ